MSGARRKNLVVVRAGRNSLHPTWLEGAAERNWDLIVSVYDPEAQIEPSDDVRVVIKRGGKWDGLYVLFADSDLLDRYDYIWLPDDDIAATKEDVNTIFDMMRRYGLEVAQPALTRDSYFTHFVCMQCPGFTLRYSNFVEIMVPCVTAGLLAKVLDDFRESESGFGMDTIWTRLSDDPHNKAAILDAIAVRHTRPVGKFLRSKMAERGRSPEADREGLTARYGLHGRPVPLVYAAVEADGKRIEDCARLGWLMVRRYLAVIREFQKRSLALEKIWQLVRRQRDAEVDLSSLRTIPRPR
jgi:hypothetical protein